MPRATTRIALWIALAVRLGDTPGAVGQDRTTPPPQFVTAEEVRALHASGRLVLLVDVRSRAEYEDVHIEGAVSIPLADLERRVAEIPREVPVVLY